jgi:hypothetical protein
MLLRIAATACVVGCLVGGAAAADEGPAGQRLVVFPLHGVNVPAGTARAASELLVSSLRDRHVDVAEYEAPEAAAPLPAAVLAPQPETAPPQAGGATLVDHATPPVYPGMASFASQPGAPAPAEGETPTLPTQEKIAIARRLGCTGYVDGDLVRLGSEIRLAVSKRDLSGAVSAARDAAVRNDDALAAAIDAIARALLGDPAADAALDRARGVRRPAARGSSRVTKNIGAVIGGMFGVADTMDLGMIAAFDARFEIGRFLAIVNAGIGMASPDKYDLHDSNDEAYDYDDDFVIDYGDGDIVHPNDDYHIGDEPPGMQAWIGADVAGYLGRGSVTPYLGAGLGMFVGGRVHVKERVNLDADDGDVNPGNDASRYWDSNIGLDLHPTFGIEFLRNTDIRLHVEARYTCNFSVNGDFGHGPIVLAGVNF